MSCLAPLPGQRAWGWWRCLRNFADSQEWILMQMTATHQLDNKTKSELLCGMRVQTSQSQGDIDYCAQWGMKTVCWEWLASRFSLGLHLPIIDCSIVDYIGELADRDIPTHILQNNFIFPPTRDSSTVISFDRLQTLDLSLGTYLQLTMISHLVSSLASGNCKREDILLQELSPLCTV
jgi:hypothetical protein